MTINDQTVTAKQFAWDGCHKIYLMNTPEDIDTFTALKYNLYPISELKTAYKESCPLKFISNGDLEKNPVKQSERAIFKGRLEN